MLPQAVDTLGADPRSTTEKLKHVMKKPFIKNDDEDVESPEMKAAAEVIEAKGLKSS